MFGQTPMFGRMLTTGPASSLRHPAMRRIWTFIIPVVLLVCASAAQAAPTTIDLRNDAVTTFISSFGVPNTATYGQLVTAPQGTAQITSFGFRVENIPATATFRGEIYAWDPIAKRATGSALYESAPTHTTSTELQDVTFDTGNTQIQAGGRYVLFMSVSKDFEANANFASKFRVLPKEEAKYPEGEFVFINNGTDEEKWTNAEWSRIEQDLQFTARFTTNQTLSVTKTGSGTGTVTSSVGGINCGSTCSATFPEGTLVTLTSTADPGSTLKALSGRGCTSSPCQVTIGDALTVTAEFADTTPPTAKITKRTKKKILFTSSESGSTFKCKLDKRKFRPCTSPFKLKRLKPGRHKFALKAIDAAGNTSEVVKLKFRRK